MPKPIVSKTRTSGADIHESARPDGPFTLLLAALTAITALSIDMSLPAMPGLAQSFHAGAASVQLTLSLFLVGYGAGQLVSGPLSERLGRRPVLLGGLGLFTVSGMLCAVSPSLWLLVVARLLQGLGASVGPTGARAIVRDRFNPHQGAAVLSQITQVMIVAPLLAPSLGGYLLRWGWPVIFWVLSGCGALLALITWRFLPETLREPPAGPGGLPLIWQGFQTVLTHPESLRYALTACFSYAGMFAYISGSPLVVMEVFHVPKEQFGYYFALTAAALMVGATANRALLARHVPEVLLRRGVMTVLAGGLAMGALGWLRWGGLPGVLMPMMLYLFGLGMVQPNAISAAMAPHGRLAGTSSSLIGGLQTVAGALAGLCVGAFYDGTPRSLALTVAGLALLTGATLLTGTRRREQENCPAGAE